MSWHGGACLNKVSKWCGIPTDDAKDCDDALSMILLGARLSTELSGKDPKVAASLEKVLSLIVRTRVIDEARSWPGHRDYKQAADVYHNGTRVANATLQNVRTNLFRTVAIEFSETGLHVSVGGDSIASGIPLLAWRPQPRWLLRVTAATGTTPGDHHWLRSLRFQVRRLPPVSVVSLKVTVNAQQYTDETPGVAITFYDVDAERGIGAYGEPPPRDSPEPEIMPHEPTPSESRRDALLAITDAMIVDAMRTPENLTWSGPESGAE